MNMHAYLHMLYLPPDLWSDMSLFIIHIGSGVLPFAHQAHHWHHSIMKSQFAQGAAAEAAAAKSGHKWLVNMGTQNAADKH